MPMILWQCSRMAMELPKIPYEIDCSEDRQGLPKRLREIGSNRNSDGTYQPCFAHKQAHLNVAPYSRVFAHETVLRQAVAEKLAARWSPGQISRWLRRCYPLKIAWHVCRNLYDAVYWGLILGANAVGISHLQGVSAPPRTGQIQGRHQDTPRQCARSLPGRRVWRPARPEIGNLNVSVKPRERCQTVLVSGAVAEHVPEGVDAAAGEGDEGLFVWFAFSAFAVIEGS